ncbi:hypothetical protein LCGC14_2671990 [marine sediment metagenome]|uniref:Uncharacterized protein n=1 Tax=marine sediment metagenome TaxID=412755 RepID=A0A0F8ZNV1_9ZZZZ
MYGTRGCQGCGSGEATAQGLAAYEPWMKTGLGAIYDNPEVTGVVQVAIGMVRFMAPGVNFRLLGTPEIIEGLKLTQGYCIIIRGAHLEGGYVVEGFTLLTDGSAGNPDAPYSNCADMLAVSTPGHPPTTDAPPAGGGDQPEPGTGQTAAGPSGPDGPAPSGDGIPPATAAGMWGALAVVALLPALVKWRGN